MTKQEHRQERIDQMLLPYRKSTMALKAVRWELEAIIQRPSSKEAPCSTTTTIS